METIFWVSLLLITYTYLGYPLLLALLREVGFRPMRRGFFEPTVSVVVAAAEEEHNIARRLENLLAQEYPAEKLEIIVVSDASRDRTAELVRGVGNERVRLVRLEQKGGKAAALNAGVACATGELVLFCDARQVFEDDVVKQLASNFADPEVGCASGELVLLEAGGGGLPAAMGAYWRYEKWIRRAEGETGSVMGSTGAIHAIRRELFDPLPAGVLLDDVMIPMNIVRRGKRVVFDPTARAYDEPSSTDTQEWVRKVRTLAGNWQLMAYMPWLLNPFGNPCWLRFLSHKVLRLVMPPFLVALAVSAPLLPGVVYYLVTLLQVAFYGMAALGRLVPASRSNGVVSLCYFFAALNVMAICGFWRWARGESSATWQPAYKQGT